MGPWTLLIGAALLAQTGLDRDLSDWAMTETPVYGSIEDAKDWSDRLRSWSGAAMVASHYDNPDALVASIGIAESTRGIIGRAKHDIERERPDASNALSMPSGHTATTTVQGNLSRWAVFHDVIPALAAWSRVEAGRHYPSDVLAGYAIGKLMVRFEPGERSVLLPDVRRDYAGVVYLVRF